jgi:hypothetical protein
LDDTIVVGERHYRKRSLYREADLKLSTQGRFAESNKSSSRHRKKPACRHEATGQQATAKALSSFNYECETLPVADVRRKLLSPLEFLSEEKEN